MNGKAIRWGTEAAVMLAAALLLTVLGPFGSWALPLGQRAGDWLLFAGGGYLCFRPVVWVAAQLAEGTPLGRVPALVSACLLAAVPTTVLVSATIGGVPLADLRVGTLLAQYPEVALVGLLVTGVQVYVGRRRAPAAAAATPAPAVAAPEMPAPVRPATPGPAFLDRLPPALGRDLLALEQEDHYLRAHTALGSTLLLMRMRDAAAELAGTDGARVHRSWWVARGAVAAVERRERAVVLRLSNGLAVPVARASAPELRDAGWW